MILVPIKVINLPEGFEIRTFPDAVSVLCRGKLDDLKNLDSLRPKDQKELSSIERIVEEDQEIKSILKAFDKAHYHHV